jgi:hypothetical protein
MEPFLIESDDDLVPSINAKLAPKFHWDHQSASPPQTYHLSLHVPIIQYRLSLLPPWTDSCLFKLATRRRLSPHGPDIMAPR